MTTTPITVVGGGLAAAASAVAAVQGAGQRSTRWPDTPAVIRLRPEHPVPTVVRMSCHVFVRLRHARALAR